MFFRGSPLRYFFFRLLCGGRRVGEDLAICLYWGCTGMIPCGQWGYCLYDCSKGRGSDGRCLTNNALLISKQYRPLLSMSQVQFRTNKKNATPRSRLSLSTTIIPLQCLNATLREVRVRTNTKTRQQGITRRYGRRLRVPLMYPRPHRPPLK